MSPVEASAAGPYHPLRVARVIRETSDAISVVLEVPDDQRAHFLYRAGQFLTFRVQVAGHRLVRCYSLASSPEVEREHKVTVKRVAGGRVSNWLNDELAQGHVLEVMRPAGHFCLQEADTPIVLFGAGSGITPIISLVKSALATSARPLRLVYANRDVDSIIFRDEIDALAGTHPERFEVIHRLDDTHGFVDAEEVRRQVGDWLDADFYVCGPGAFMDVVEEALAGLGVPASRIFIERFVHPEHEQAGGEDAGAEAASLARVHLDGETHEVPCRPGETLLAAARRAGIEPPFACEEGYCGCCMARVKSGSIEMIHNDGGIDAEQEAEGWVLTCQGVPQTDRVEIEYPD